MSSSAVCHADLCLCTAKCLVQRSCVWAHEELGCSKCIALSMGPNCDDTAPVIAQVCRQYAGRSLHTTHVILEHMGCVVCRVK